MLCLFSYLVDGSCTKIPALQAGTQTPSSVFFGNSKGLVCDRVGGTLLYYLLPHMTKFLSHQNFHFWTPELMLCILSKSYRLWAEVKKKCAFSFCFSMKNIPQFTIFQTTHPKTLKNYHFKKKQILLSQHVEPKVSFVFYFNMIPGCPLCSS